MFGRVICMNGQVMFKIVLEPFIVTLNRKIRIIIFVPLPPVFAKMIKTEVDLKIRHIFWRFVLNFDEVLRNPWTRFVNEIFFVSQEHSKVNYDFFENSSRPDEKLTSWRRLNRLSKTSFWLLPKIEGAQTYEPDPRVTLIPKHHPH